MAKVLLAFLVLITCHSSIHVAATVIVQVGPVTLPLNNVARGFLEAHNAARAAVRVNPLNWSNTIARAAGRRLRHQLYQKNCAFVGVTGTPHYGTNQLWDGKEAVKPQEMVKYWVNQKRYYNYPTNTCAYGQNCGAYTQVVWQKTLRFGCAEGLCPNNNGTLGICFYYPRGNVGGQWPY